MCYGVNPSECECYVLAIQVQSGRVHSRVFNQLRCLVEAMAVQIQVMPLSQVTAQEHC